MAGPRDQVAIRYVVPPGEAQRIYSPGALAWRIENFRVHEDGYLASVTGPCPYEPDRGQGYPSLDGRPHGLFHAGLLGGAAGTLLLRAGTVLYRHTGWTRGYGALTGAGTVNADATVALTAERRPVCPDQFLQLGDKITWTNGIDRALVITADGMVVPLGFDDTPGVPVAQGPEQPSEDQRSTLLPNSLGYSWPGRIGTVGDVLDGQTGSLLAGAWRYAYRYEDVHGNLGPIGVASEVVRLFTQRSYLETSTGGAPPNSNPYVELDDLLRQFVVRLGGANPPVHAVATHLLRTADIPRNGPGLRLHSRLGGRSRMLVPDKLSDSELGPEVAQTVPVPVFRCMAHHEGSLLIGNFPGDPGRVRKSEPGFPGTFPVNAWVYPDAGGAEVVALASHAGRALAFTESAVYEITDFADPRQLAKGIGCTAPRSLCALPGGSLVWLSRDGFYAMSPGGSIEPISTDIHRLVTGGVSRSRARLAVSAYDPASREYLCAVSPAGRDANRLILRFDGRSWRRMDLGFDVNDICVTDDWRQLVLFAGRDLTNNINGVWVLDHEVAATVYTPPPRSYTYRSGWLRADEHALDPVNVRAIFLGLVDGSNAQATVRLYRDGSWRVLETFTNVELLGKDEDSRVVTDIAASAVIGTSLFHERRLFWRWVPCGEHLRDVHTWAFEISSTSRINIAAFAFDVSQATHGSPRGRVARHDEV